MSEVYVADLFADTSAEMTESPLWDPAVGLRWLDVPGKRLHTASVDGRRTSVALQEIVTAVESSVDGRLFAVTATGFGWLDADTGGTEAIATTISDEALSMNDGGIDPAGRCWAGSAVRDDSRRGALFSIEGTTVTRHVDGLGMSNGIDFSPAGDVMYHVDSTAGTVNAWEFDGATGALGASHALRRIPTDTGLPDGLTVDVDGGVWLAVWGTGQVWRLDPKSGETTAIVEIPTPQATSCAFGGSDLSTLYVTSENHENPPGGGMVYAVDVPARGRLPHRFAGDPS